MKNFIIFLLMSCIFSVSAEDKTSIEYIDSDEVNFLADIIYLARDTYPLNNKNYKTINNNEILKQITLRITNKKSPYNNKFKVESIENGSVGIIGLTTKDCLLKINKTKEFFNDFTLFSVNKNYENIWCENNTLKVSFR